jgi:STIP1 homology and U-box containing protein 1
MTAEHVRLPRRCPSLAQSTQDTHLCRVKLTEPSGQAQLELHHPNEALSSALTAYELCSHSVHQTSSAFAISTFVLKCKKAKWELRERDRLWRRSELLRDLEAKLVRDKDTELESIQERARAGELGQIAVQEESNAVEESSRLKVEELRNAFSISHPDHLQKRVRAMEPSPVAH